MGNDDDQAARRRIADHLAETSGGVLRTALPGGRVLATEWAGDGEFRQFAEALGQRAELSPAAPGVIARAVAECFGCPDPADTARLVRAAEFAAMLIRHQPCQCPAEGSASCVRCAALGEIRATPRGRS